MKKPILILTKNAEDAHLTQKQLPFTKIDIHCLPLITVHPIAYQTPNSLTNPYDYYIFISKNSIRFSRSFITNHLQTVKTKTLLTIGVSTAKLLTQEYQMTAEYPSIADSNHLLKLPTLSTVKGKKVLIIRGRNGLNTLKNTLTLKGAVVDYLNVYERKPLLTHSEEIIKMLSQADLPKIFIISSQLELDTLIALSKKSMPLKNTWVILSSKRLVNEMTQQQFEQIYISNPSDIEKINQLINSILSYYDQKQY